MHPVGPLSKDQLEKPNYDEKRDDLWLKRMGTNQIAQLTGLLYLQAALCNGLQHCVLIYQTAAKCFANLGAVDHCRQRCLCHANGAHAMVDAPWPQSPLKHKMNKQL